MAKNLNVLVSGASIAGPCAAYWLAKTGICNVTVIERFPELRKGGQNVDIRTFGCSVMRAMDDMEATVKASLAPIDGFRLVTSQGKEIATMRGTGDPDQQSLVSEYEIFRGDLSKILYDLSLKQGQKAGSGGNKVKYVFGEQISNIEYKQGPGGPARVTFANGKLPDDDYDLIVAADGTGSRTRALAFHCDVLDHSHSMKAIVAYYSVRRDLGRDARIGTGFTAPPGRTFFVGADHDPSKARVGLWYNVPTGSAGEKELQEYRQLAKVGTKAVQEWFDGKFRGAGWIADELLDLAKDSDDFYSSEWAQIKAETLSQGRLALVGDAGYASGAGLGTSLALFGAYTLAGELAASGGDVALAFKAYEQKMRPVIRESQKLPPGVPALMAPQTWWATTLRNAVIMVICRLMAVGSWVPGWLSGLWSSAFASAPGGYALEDYPWKC